MTSLQTAHPRRRVHRIVKRVRYRVVLFASLLVFASFTAIPATVHADDPADTTGSGPHNIVQVQSHHDGDLRVKGHVQLGRVPGAEVAPVNFAAAVNVCESACDTLAVALQINLVNRNFTMFAPQNVAVAANGGCDGCRAIAVALQYNIGVDDPSQVPPQVNRLVAQMRQVLAQLDAHSTSLEEAIALSDSIYLLSQGPRAHIIRDYVVPLPRPRDPIRARAHPAFAPLYERLWNDLSAAVDQSRHAEAAE